MRRNSSHDKPNFHETHSTRMNTQATSSARKGGYQPVSNPSRPPSSVAPDYPQQPKPSSRPFYLAAITLSFLLLAFLFIAPLSGMSARDRFQAALFGTSPQHAKSATSSMSTESVSRLNAFSISLFNRVATSGQNVFISPLSVASALGMAAAGATEGSPTSTELRQALGAEAPPLPGSADPKVTLNVANSAWISARVKPTFVKDVKSTFNADVQPIPQDVSIINSWVSKRTGGMIPSIIDSIPSNVVSILVNAVFFKAAWTTAFDPASTVDGPFYAPSGRDHSPKSANVRMMKLRNSKFPYAEGKLPSGEPVQIVDVPYGQHNAYVATIVVPTAKATLDDVVAGLNAEVWNGWTSNMMETKLSLLSMPRFKMEYGASLKATLQAIGIKAAFKGDRDNGAFLRMTDDKDTYIDDVLHKAAVECTEAGTVASAATAVVLMSRSLPRASPMVVLDRPFLFTIRNRVSGALLFMGRVDNPISP